MSDSTRKGEGVQRSRDDVLQYERNLGEKAGKWLY